MRRVRLIAAFTLVLGLAGCRGAERREDARRWPGAPVILISIDTLRADHLPAFGYSGVETPAIDALRRDGILFRNAYAHVPLTLPSHATMLTGQLPGDNGVRDNVGYQVRAGHDSLPEILHRSGYATGAAVSAYVLRGETGLRALFDDYDDAIPFRPGADLGDVERPGAETAAIATRWIDARQSKPFFFLLHLFEPHAPYEPREPFRSRYRNPYDGEIASADAIIGELVAHLRAIGVYDRAMIVISGDHGEGLGDHGEQEHGIFLYREALHVPLIVKLPHASRAGEAVDAPVGLIDLLPTIVAATGNKVPADRKGASLLDAPRKDRYIFSETMYPRLHFGWSDLRSLVGAQYHAIDAPRPELYDVVRDPGERANAVDANRRQFAAMREEAARYARTPQAPSPVSAEEAAKFAALGYVSAPAAAGEGPLPDPKDRLADLELIRGADAASKTGDFNRAIKTYREVLSRNPRLTDAVTRLATAYEAAGRLPEAVETYRRLLQLNPAVRQQVALSLAVIYKSMGRYGEAAAHARLALEKEPGAAHLLLGQIALARRDAAQAEREAQFAAADPHFADRGLLLQAEALTRGGPAGAARALGLLDAAKANRVVRGLESQRALALLHMDRAGDAERAYNEEIARFPDNRDAYADLAALYLLQRRTSEADAVFRRLASVDPSPRTYTLAADTFEHFGAQAAAAVWRGKTFGR
jgi:arylsulfatase A-like enzyme